MRDLEKNKQTVYYSLHSSSSIGYSGNEILINGVLVDEETGDNSSSFATPVKLKINIMPVKNDSKSEVFGYSLVYTKVMSTCNLNLNLPVGTLIWVNKPTTDDADYEVVGIAESLNSQLIAINIRN